MKNGEIDPQAARKAIPPEPLLAIGMVDGPDAYLLHSIRGLTRLANGTIVVVNGGTQEVRFFSSDGEHLRTVGGRGDGPGEFREIVGAYRIGRDTVLVHDVVARRLTYFDAEGERLFVRPLEISPGRGGIAGVFPDGSLLLARFEDGRPRREREIDRGVVRYHRYWPDATAPRVNYLFEQPWATFTAVRLNGRVVESRQPFGVSGTARVSGERIVSGQSDSFRFEIRDGLGDIVFISQSQHDPRPFSDRDAQEFLELMRGRGIPPGGLRRHERATYPDVYPAWNRMETDPSGRVWLRVVRTVREEATLEEWLVYKPDGAFHAVVEMPQFFELREVGVDWLLGVGRDGMGVEAVQLFSVPWHPNETP